VALHVIPEGEDAQHQRDENCPCFPAKTEGHTDVGRGRNRTSYRGVIYTHASTPATRPAAASADELASLVAEVAGIPMSMLSERVSVPTALLEYVAPPADPESGPEADCGHIVIDVDGEWQHHDIPDDDAPHSASSECGCGPARRMIHGHIVYEHVDQDGEHVDDLEGV